MFFLFFFVFAFLYVFYIPGFVISKKFFPLIKKTERVFQSLSFGLIIMPFIYFSIGFVLNLTISFELVLVSSTIFILIFRNEILKGLLDFKSFNSKLFNKKFSKISYSTFIFVIFFLLTFLTYFFWFDSTSFNFDECIEETLVLTGTSKEVIPAFEHPLYKRYQNLTFFKNEGNLINNLVVNNSPNTTDQRIGVVTFFTSFFALFGLLGMRLLFSFSAVIFSFSIYFLALKIYNKKKLALILLILAVFNPLTLSYPAINENFTAMVVISFLFYLLFSKETNFYLTGVIYGILLTIRPMFLLSFPAILLFFIFKKKKLNLLKRFFAGFLFPVLFLLFWKIISVGNIFKHESFLSFPIFEHNFLGFSFNFPGLLNFPFFSHIIKTPGNPFPAGIMLVLIFLQSFGFIIFSFFSFGFFNLYKNFRKFFLFLMLWTLPIFILLFFQENWYDVEKMTFSFLFLPTVIIFLGFGINYVLEFVNKKNLLIFSGKLLAFTIIIFIFVSSFWFFDAPDDLRVFKVGEVNKDVFNFFNERTLATQKLKERYLNPTFLPTNPYCISQLTYQDRFNQKNCWNLYEQFSNIFSNSKDVSNELSQYTLPRFNFDGFSSCVLEGRIVVQEPRLSSSKNGFRILLPRLLNSNSNSKPEIVNLDFKQGFKKDYILSNFDCVVFSFNFRFEKERVIVYLLVVPRDKYFGTPTKISSDTIEFVLPKGEYYVGLTGFGDSQAIILEVE